MNKADMSKVMENLFLECRGTRDSGQKEYALSEDAFDNFNRLATLLNQDRKIILWIYLQKHLDGIVSHLKGHTSQREPVRGRIKDAIVYLTLLAGMIEEDENTSVFSHTPNIKAVIDTFQLGQEDTSRCVYEGCVNEGTYERGDGEYVCLNHYLTNLL